MKLYLHFYERSIDDIPHTIIYQSQDNTTKISDLLNALNKGLKLVNSYIYTYKIVLEHTII